MNKNASKGFSLPVVMLLLTIGMLASTSFMARSVSELLHGGSSRNTDAALSIADAALSRVYGMFASQLLSVADIDGDGVIDRSEGYVDLSASPTTLPLSYSYYVPGATKAQLLQRVANGEGAEVSCAENDQKIGCAALSVSNLFLSGTIKPLVFTSGVDGMMESANTWATEVSKDKAAAWLEVVVNPSNPNWIDLYVEAVGQSGAGVSFVQRYIGSYSDQLGAAVAPITESK